MLDLVARFRRVLECAYLLGNFVAASIEEITKEIVELPRHQRLAPVRLLLDLETLA